MRTIIKRIAVGVPLLLLAGCGATAPGPTGEQRAAVGDLEARAPSRGKARGGERMRRTVRWPAEATRDLATYEGLDERSRAAIDQAPVPVLVPSPEVGLHHREVLRGPEWYAFWGRHEGPWTPLAPKPEEANPDGANPEPVDVAVTVTLQASRMARVYPGVRPQPGPHTLRGQEALVTRNEGIWSASWLEHGVAYDLELECAPVDAPPCNDQAELEALAESLRYVGGRAEAGDAREAAETAEARENGEVVR